MAKESQYRTSAVMFAEDVGIAAGAELQWWWWWAHEQGTVERIQRQRESVRSS